MAGDWATWQGVGAGAFTIQGATPEGFGEPVIVCGSYHGSSLTIDWPTAMTGEFFATFDDEVGQIMTCDWFNLPASNGVSLPTGD
jgi:hypothetical protein